MNEITKPLTKFLPVEVPEDNPFQYDALGRKEICEKLTLLIRTSTTPFVLAVDTEWGNGKTTFLKMWQKYLESNGPKTKPPGAHVQNTNQENAHLANNGFRTVFFDAWRCDFYDEALPALIGEIEKQIKPQDKVGEAFKKFKTAGGKLVKSLPSAVTKATLSSLVGETAVAELQKALQKNDKIQDFLDYLKAVEDFKKALGALAGVSKAQEAKEQKPLVIFIDELDRCRPTFALEVLERVKHIFDVENVFFVIAVNKKEFAETIKSEYGNIDGDAYLQKFFDATTVLRNDNKKFIEMLIQKLRINTTPEPLPGSKPQKPRYSHLFSTPCNGPQIFLTLCNAFDISLRVQEQIMSLLSIVSGALKEKTPFIEIKITEDYNHGQEKHSVKIDDGGLCLFFFFAILKVTNPDQFREMADSLNIRNRGDSPASEIRGSINNQLNMLQHGSAENVECPRFIQDFINRFLLKLNQKEGQLSEWLQFRENYGAFYISNQFIDQVVERGGPRKILATLLEIIDLVE